MHRGWINAWGLQSDYTKKRRTRSTDSRAEKGRGKNCDHPSFYLSVSLALSSPEGRAPSRKLAKNQTESSRRKRERRRCRFRSTRDPTNLQFNVGIGMVERIRRRSGESRRRGGTKNSSDCVYSVGVEMTGNIVSLPRATSHARDSLSEDRLSD